MAAEPDTTGGEVAAKRRASAHEAGVAGSHSGDAPKAAPVPGPAAQQLVELHVCMGLNSCAATPTTRHDPDGTAKMAGMGSCATVLHACHGDNACRGQGGCGYAGSELEQMKPGDQSCNANGSCASPINISRLSSAGPNKGKSVWRLARQIFETRMYDAGVTFGPSPGEGYPDDLVPGGGIE
jgi:hypothetical protein